jgi:hypothetical protein
MMIAQMALQMAQQSPPGMFNIEELNRTILNAANMPNLEKILPPKKKPQPMDPVSDIMSATKGIPIAAFAGQNHDAHIQTKMAYLQDPMNGANPIMARIKPILEANIQEHSVMKYQEQISGVTKMAGQQNPQAVEMAMAQAAQQVLNANQAMGMAQSPEQQMVALEQAKVELEKEKLKMSSAKNSAEAALESQKLEIEEMKLLKDSAVAGQTAMMKKQKGDMDRASKETMKSLDLLTKTVIADQKAEIDLEKIRADAMKKVAELDDVDDRTRSFKLIDFMSEAIKEQMNNGNTRRDTE